MTDRQTHWTIFFIAVVTVIDMQKQIDKLKAEDEDLKHLIVKLTNANVNLNKDLDATQELQRKQAQMILDLKKGKRK